MYPSCLSQLRSGCGVDEAVMCESKRGAEYAARPRFRTQHHRTQRDVGGKGISLGDDREPDEDKQPDPLLDWPRKPQIQTAAAEIVKDRIFFEQLSVDVDAPH